MRTSPLSLLGLTSESLPVELPLSEGIPMAAPRSACGSSAVGLKAATLSNATRPRVAPYRELESALRSRHWVTGLELQVNPQQEKCADDRTDPTGSLAGLIPAHRLKGIPKTRKARGLALSFCPTDDRAPSDASRRSILCSASRSTLDVNLILAN
jgi:hypothetical protein